VPGGASGHPGSAHYQDQGPLYEAHRTLPMTYDWEQVAAAAATTQRLLPR
jgi:penicillin amidase